jgi:hypothetical protein
MTTASSKLPLPNPYYRCSGPNCGLLKGTTDHWWLMWVSNEELGVPVLHVCAWDEQIAQKEATLHVCGERCAQKLQSQFLGNILENLQRKTGR